jgi:hypothetical protein
VYSGITRLLPALKKFVTGLQVYWLLGLIRNLASRLLWLLLVVGVAALVWLAFLSAQQ